MSRTFWLRLVLILPITIGVQLLLRDRVDLQPDVGSVGAFVTAVGTLYSVLTGFTVVYVFDRPHNQGRRDLALQAAAELDAVRAVGAAEANLVAPAFTPPSGPGRLGTPRVWPPTERSSARSSCSGRRGGNALIGRELYPLLTKAGFSAVRVSPRMVYVDSSRPELVDGFTRKTFTAMIEGVRESAIAAGLVEPAVFDRGIRDLYRTAEPDGVFCYTFFKALERE